MPKYLQYISMLAQAESSDGGIPCGQLMWTCHVCVGFCVKIIRECTLYSFLPIWMPRTAMWGNNKHPFLFFSLALYDTQSLLHWPHCYRNIALRWSHLPHPLTVQSLWTPTVCLWPGLSAAYPSLLLELLPTCPQQSSELLVFLWLFINILNFAWLHAAKHDHTSQSVYVCVCMNLIMRTHEDSLMLGPLWCVLQHHRVAGYLCQKKPIYNWMMLAGKCPQNWNAASASCLLHMFRKKGQECLPTSAYFHPLIENWRRE